jgi:SAM-dependent methyltransferase
MERGKGSHQAGVAYVLPRHPNEIDRLDVQHYAIKAAMGGSNFLAPIGQLDSSSRILDAGSGTGQWAYEVCAEFTEAAVVGLDLDPSKPEHPPNYRFVRGNVLQGMPFADESFDFVHQRLLVSGVPVRRWPEVVEDLVRVTRPGGWVELLEASPGMEPEGPATKRLYDLLRQLGRSVGLDTLGHVFGSLDRYLAEAGTVAVQRRTLEVPVGEWAGQVGALMTCDYRALFTRLAGTFASRYGVSDSECGELLAAMLAEFEELQPIIRMKVVMGRRPA